VPPAFAHDVAKVLAHSVGHQKLGVFRPAVCALRQLDFFFAERLAVRFLCVLPVRRAVANVAVDDDQFSADPSR